MGEEGPKVKEVCDQYRGAGPSCHLSKEYTGRVDHGGKKEKKEDDKEEAKGEKKATKAEKPKEDFPGQLDGFHGARKAPELPGNTSSKDPEEEKKEEKKEEGKEEKKEEKKEEGKKEEKKGDAPKE